MKKFVLFFAVTVCFIFSGCSSDEFPKQASDSFSENGFATAVPVRKYNSHTGSWLTELLPLQVIEL